MPVPQDPVTHDMHLLASHARLTGRSLLERKTGESDAELAARLCTAPWVLVARGVEPDPWFNYANLMAQQLFGRTWDEFIGLPSRLSAETPARDERERLLARVTAHGFIDDYSGLRIAKSGRRFRIRRATVWNVSDATGQHIGQAATFSEWDQLSDEE